MNWKQDSHQPKKIYKVSKLYDHLRGGLLELYYRLGTVNSKSFVRKVLLRIKWKLELPVHFKHEMLGK